MCPKLRTRHEAEVHVVLGEEEVGHALVVEPPVPADGDVVARLQEAVHDALVGVLMNT